MKYALISRTRLLYLLACLAALHPPALCADDGHLTQPLFEYVHRDDTFPPTYDKRFEAQTQGLDIQLYTVRSQVWQGHDLFNQMYTAIPTGIDPSEVKHVLLVITGGSFRSRLFEPPSQREIDRFLVKAKRYSPLITRLNTAAVVVRHVPFQRMKICENSRHERGQSEDALIACTLKKYLETGDPQWPLLFPMAKTVKVNMDIAQKIFKDEWGAEVETFTAIGASKRGWTAHMISIVDDRVTASIPIVINMLNMPAYIQHALDAWGTHSPQIQDYANHGILQQFDSEAGAHLLAMIDPYSYREHLDKPKLLIYGTNDPYWPVDSTRHYTPDLPGETRLVFLPNEGHKPTLGGLRLLTAASHAMHQSAASGEPLATLNWQYTERAETLKIEVETDNAPAKIEYWRATSNDRDFRDDKWTKRIICGGRNALPWTWFRRACSKTMTAEVTVPKQRCRAQFAQVYFEHDGFARYPNSTDIAVTGPSRCITTSTLNAEGSTAAAR